MVSSINLRMAAIGKTCPAYFPPYSTVYWHSLQWRAEGAIETLMSVLHGQVRSSGEKKAKWTTLMMIDSQAVKNTCNAVVSSPKAFAITNVSMGSNAI